MEQVLITKGIRLVSRNCPQSSLGTMIVLNSSNQRSAENNSYRALSEDGKPSNHALKSPIYWTSHVLQAKQNAKPYQDRLSFFNRS